MIPKYLSIVASMLRSFILPDCSLPHDEFLNGAVMQWTSVLEFQFKGSGFVSHRGWNFSVVILIQNLLISFMLIFISLPKCRCESAGTAETGELFFSIEKLLFYCFHGYAIINEDFRH